jgi:two-component system, cell cycle sensor histidine kinase and response regulator CckA
MQKEQPECFIEQEQLLKENAALRKKLHDLESKTSALEASCRSLAMARDAAEKEHNHQSSSSKNSADKLLHDRNLPIDGPITFFRWKHEPGLPIEYVSSNIISLLGYSAEELSCGSFWYETIIHGDDIVSFRDNRQRFEKENVTSIENEYRLIKKDGSAIWVYGLSVMIRDQNHTITHYEGYVQDITKRKKSEETFSRTQAFARQVKALSNELINLPYGQIDSLINNTLKLIGELAQADRSYIFQFSNDLRLMDNTHEWCAEGIEPEISRLQKLPTETVAWWMAKITNNKVINIARVADMPVDALAEKKILEEQHIKSLLVIPLAAGSLPFGFIGFDAVRRERRWRPEIVSILKLAGGIIANSLKRSEVEHFIQAELDLAIQLNSSSSFQETLQICLHAAISVSRLDCGGIYLVNRHKQTIALAFHEGLPQSFVDHASSYPISSEHAGLILKGKPIYQQFSQIMIEKDDVILTEKLQAIAIVPIRFKGEVIACLNIASHTLTEIPEFARKGLETVTAHIGAAIIQARHEKEIAEAKTNLESLFDTIEDFLFIVDMEGIVIHTNAYVRNQLGYTSDALRGKHVLHFHPEEQRKEAQENIEAMLSGSTQACCRVPLKTSSGSLIPVETKVTFGVWNNQPVLFGISRNVSERKLSEQALIESEKRFRELTKLLPLPLFETDTRGEITYTNQKSCEVFGYSPEDLQHHISALQFFIPQKDDKSLNDIERITQKTPLPKEYKAVRMDGRRFPALLYSSPIIHNGELTGTRCIVVDLTELKKAEKAVRKGILQARIVNEFQSLIDNIPGTVYRTNDQGRTTILSMASDFQQNHTLEALEKDLFETGVMIHPEDIHAVSVSNRTLRAEKSSHALIYRIIMENGSIRWVEDRKTSVFSSNGLFTGIDGILFDITDRIMAQEEKLQLESYLRKTQRLETIGTLAGGIAHDFNNILTPILGYAEMGVLNSTDADPMHEYFTEIMRAAERAQNLVSQILTFSRTREITMATVSVQDIVDEALKLLRPSIPSTISINQHCGGTCRNIHADPSQIHQVIVNLCTNAFQAMEESGGVLTIELSEISPAASLQKLLPKLQAESYIQLTISDTGSGMDEPTMERIFEPFFTTKSVDKGTGLGLSVVHGIITSFKGEITVESTLGQGSVFRVYLPIINEKAVTSTLKEPPVKGNGRILFVDDEPAAREIMTMMITKLGFSIEALSSPQQALQLFRHHPESFDLIITDLTMPEMTGIELARELHKTLPQLPVILMTGYGKNLEFTTPLNKYGIRCFLKKPVNIKQLASTINEVISSNNS